MGVVTIVRWFTIDGFVKKKKIIIIIIIIIIPFWGLR
jgi:hypothetical protein